MNYSPEFIELLKQEDIRDLLQDKEFGQLYKKIDESLVPEFTDFCYKVLNLDVLKHINYIPKKFLYKSDIEQFTIPDNVTTIGSDAFYNCSKLTNVHIPNSITSIGNYAFKNCTSLESIQIPDTVTDIGNSAFSRCSSLTSIEIPNKVTSIGEYAFYDCFRLIRVVIPNSVERIGAGALEYCHSLTSIQYEGTKEEAIQLGIGDKSNTKWRLGSSIEKIICNDGEINLY